MVDGFWLWISDSRSGHQTLPPKKSAFLDQWESIPNCLSCHPTQRLQSPEIVAQPNMSGRIVDIEVAQNQNSHFMSPLASVESGKTEDMVNLHSISIIKAHWESAICSLFASNNWILWVEPVRIIPAIQLMPAQESYKSTERWQNLQMMACLIPQHIGSIQISLPSADVVWVGSMVAYILNKGRGLYKKLQMGEVLEKDLYIDATQGSSISKIHPT